MTQTDPDDRELRLAQALAEFADLEVRGEAVSIRVFCHAYPDLEPELSEQLKTLVSIGDMSSSQGKDLPESLSGHKLMDEVGSGGMGRVFLAFDEGLGRKVAIKMLARRYWDHSELRSRFMQEARAMARLNHPNIVRIYNLGQAGELPHFVMEYVEGVPLNEAAKPLTLHQKIEIMHKVAVAADFLHQHQMVHRDLKPGNILVGPDLQPKLLDFGLALNVGGRDRLSRAGDVLGTPEYFSPEQARGDARLNARSDVFSLGIVLYELLTGRLPFRGTSLDEQTSIICDSDPVLPRRLNPNLPGDLQNICLKALEKNPEERYGSAREMAEDLERFLAGEQTIGVPTSYSRLVTGKIEQHVRELEGWRQDQILSEPEFTALRKGYNRLIEREDAWIMEVRRLTLPQVSLYLGAWIAVVGAALLVLFEYTSLAGTAKVLVAAGAAAPMAYIGVRCWKQGRLRTGVAYLLAFCLLLPISFLVAAAEYRMFAGLTQEREDLELFIAKFSFFKTTTNAQLWWSVFLSLPAYVWLRRFTHASVFSLVFAVMSALLCLITLLRMGMLEWMDTDHGRVYFHLIPIALIFFAAGLLIERLKHPGDSRHFFPIAVAFTLIPFTGLAADHEPYQQLLERMAPWTRGQIAYLFIINAGIYLMLQAICERLPSLQMRSVARAFRFVIPGEVLLSLLVLGLVASERWDELPAEAARRLEARTFEILLPAAACVFVFRSISRQMKNYFVWGMVFLAIAIVRLQQDLFKNYERAWLIGLLLGGLALMLTATNYTAIRMTLLRWFRRKT